MAGHSHWANIAIKKGAAEFYPLLKKMAVDEQVDEVRRAIAILALSNERWNSEFITDAIKSEIGELAVGLLAEDQPATIRGAAAMVDYPTTD